jgi:H+/gluconate symporter-like permease
MPIVIVIAGVAALLFLIIKLRFNAFIALIVVAIGVGLAQGMPLVCSDTVKACVLKSIEKGVGGTLGQLALILGLGAMLGSLIADSGAAQNIANKLIEKFGLRYVQWSVIATGFIVGVPMFYNVGFIILIPIIFVIARSTGLPILYVGIPMAASLSVTHGFLPPHPGPTAIAVMYNANIGLTLLSPCRRSSSPGRSSAGCSGTARPPFPTNCSRRCRFRRSACLRSAAASRSRFRPCC